MKRENTRGKPKKTDANSKKRKTHAQLQYGADLVPPRRTGGVTTSCMDVRNSPGIKRIC